MNIAMVEKPVLSVHAWRVTFKAPTTEADFGSLVPDAPRPLVAVREELNVADALDALLPKLEFDGVHSNLGAARRDNCRTWHGELGRRRIATASGEHQHDSRPVVEQPSRVVLRT